MMKESLYLSEGKQRTKRYEIENTKQQNEISNKYTEAMLTREQYAKEFIKSRTEKTLKEYLADQSIPYNVWKDANHEYLVKLIIGEDL